MTRPRKWFGRVLPVFCLAATLLDPGPARAHNSKTHQTLVEMAYQLMRAATLPPGRAQVVPFTTPPAGYADFVVAMDDAVSFWRHQPSGLQDHEKNCGDADNVQLGAAPGQCLGAVRIPIDTGWTSSPDACPVRPNWAPGGFLNVLDPVTPGAPTTRDHTGNILGFWAVGPDRNIDDTHLWFRPTNALGLGTAFNAFGESLKLGAASMMVPVYCAAEVICDVLSWFNLCSPSKDCFKQAEEAGDKVNVVDNVEGLIPGTGDITDEDCPWMGLTGAWHHTSMNPNNSNFYDDRQGLFFEEGGPIPSAFDFAVLVAADVTGLSLNYDESQGPHKYQITNGADFHENTDYRDKGEWQSPTLAHLTFEPADNLAKYGWEKWKETGNTAFIGYPLHALADATNPQHIVGAIGQGHRPFEDATDERLLWLRHVLLPSESETTTSLQAELDFGSPKAAEQFVQAKRIVARAFDYRNLILNWRQTHGVATDVPVRDLQTAVATWSYDYVHGRYTNTDTFPWPFLDAASALYLASQGEAKAQYFNYSSQNSNLDNDELTRPLYEEAIAALIAFLTSAAERPPDQTIPCDDDWASTPTPTPTPCVPGVFCPNTPVPLFHRAGPASAAAPASGPPLIARNAICVGDCTGDRIVTVDELILMINIALGAAGSERCTAGDPSGDGRITVDEIVLAVNNALTGCSPATVATPTVTATPTGSPPSPQGVLDRCAAAVRDNVRRQDLSPLEANRLYQQYLLQDCLADPNAPMNDDEAAFRGTCLNMEHHRLAELFIARQLDASGYLGLMRDRAAKGSLARRTRGYVQAFVAGDEDGDCVPDSLDHCPSTPPNTVTDDHGCPDPLHARPEAPDDDDVRAILGRFTFAFDENCVDAGHPGMPKPIKFGYNSVDRTTLKLAIVPVSREPAACPLYYEFNFSMRTIQNAVPVDVYVGFVVADTENAEPGGSRAVFVVDGNDVGQRKLLFDNWKYEDGYGGLWRVRAVNGAGSVGPWSESILNPAPSFGEP
jgi:hypothetical protein